jgi:hypothetical protein
LVREDIVRIEPPAASNPTPVRAEAALRLALDRLDWPGGAVARLGAEVPPGRGMGSSTIDVAGVIGATFAAAGRSLDPADLLTLACAVEPSDSSALPGLWAIDHVAASRAVPLGAANADWYVVATATPPSTPSPSTPAPAPARAFPTTPSRNSAAPTRERSRASPPPPLCAISSASHTLHSQPYSELSPPPTPWASALPTVAASARRSAQEPTAPG